MKKEFKNVAIEVIRLKKTDIITTSCPIYADSSACTMECTDDTCPYYGG